MGKNKKQRRKTAPAAVKAAPDYKKYIGLFLIPLAFFAVEAFSWVFLRGSSGTKWPLVFGLLWAVMLSAVVLGMPAGAGRIAFGVVYGLAAIYAVVETGYYILFKEMMWLSDFRYASEGSDYFSVLLSYPVHWWLGILALIGLGVAAVWLFPRGKYNWKQTVAAIVLFAVAGNFAYRLPYEQFDQDKDVKYARSDYGRMQSLEAAYENLFNTHRLYQVCGLYQTLWKDIYTHNIYPLTPAYTQAHEAGREEIDAYFAEKDKPQENEMTGILKDKNVIMVLMESMDDWMLGEYTPTLNRLMSEGINFTRFYTPGYGGIRTFNTEFCSNTGSFLSSQGGYAFDYITNDYRQSLASLLEAQGYSAKEFHYNDPNFYSRGVFSQAMGYEEYVYYEDYINGLSEKEMNQLMMDDKILFDDPALNNVFFREGKRLNYIITRSAHLSYKYNEVLSNWGLKKYPEFKTLTDNEETNCALLKAKLVDDMFARMLEELEAHGELENTVIIGITDHYTYGYKNEKALLELSGVDETLLLERTPCFIWSADLEPQEVDKVLNTSDLLPTVLNLLGVESPYSYLGSDAFDDRYDGFVPFSDGSWIYGDAAWDAKEKKLFSATGKPVTLSEDAQKAVSERVQEFVRINNLILDVDYYKQ
ncbi:MAG TPA: hypothetical protein DFH97_00980 [Clostridiales bacterium]|nr:hypothetical protein [Clostridiales bacterium]